MATDYDEPRKSESDLVPESLDELQNAPRSVRTADADLEEADTAEGVELPGADLSALELTVEIIPPEKGWCVRRTAWRSAASVKGRAPRSGAASR